MLYGVYGTTSDPKQTVQELKSLVRACHEKNLAVILDVVYNHTGEGNGHGPSYCFKELGNSTYYIMNDDDTFANRANYAAGHKDILRHQ